MPGVPGGGAGVGERLGAPGPGAAAEQVAEGAVHGRQGGLELAVGGRQRVPDRVAAADMGDLPV